MRITQWGEYGAHFAIVIAAALRSGIPILSAQEIADSQGVALHYGQQILLRLKDGGIVESVRGPRGGYRLARCPSEITLLDILIASEGKTLELICETKPLDEDRCAPETPCGLRTVWYGLRKQVDEYLRGITLAELISDSEKELPPIQIGGQDRDSDRNLC